MDTTLLLALIGLVILLIVIAIVLGSKFLKKPRLNLEKKLEQLACCGIKLNRQFTIDDLIRDNDRRDLERSGYSQLLITLASDEAREPWRFLSDELYYLDHECIDSPGSYADVINNFARITKGELEIDDIDDQVEYGDGATKIELTANKKRCMINLNQDDDWLDPVVIDAMAALLNESDSELVFFDLRLNGQDEVYGCLKPADIEKLQDLGVKLKIIDNSLPVEGLTIR